MSDYPLPPISVTGGRAGHYAITHDLDLAARVLREASEELHFAAGQMDHSHGLAMDAASLAIAQVRPSVLEAQQAVSDTRYGNGGFNAVVEEISEVSRNLKEVARAYERAEAGAYQGVSALTKVRRGASDLVGVWSWATRKYASRTVSLTAANLLLRWGGAQGTAGALEPDGSPRVTGLLNGDTAAWLSGRLDRQFGISGNGYENVLWLLSTSTGILEKLAGEPHYAGVVPVSEPEAREQPQGVADLVNSIRETRDRGHGGPSIDTITLSDGTRRHVVNIPGTNDDSFSHPSPNDWDSNFRVTGNRDSDAARMARDAIEASDIRPGEPIMVQGHSQGGSVAAQLVTIGLGSKYSFTHVVTYGSAPDRIPVIREAEYLNVGVGQDLTTGGDGKTSPNLPNVTDVQLDVMAAPDPDLVALGDTILDAHSLDAYHAAGQAIDANNHASIEAWRESVSDFFGDGVVSRQYFAPTFTEPGVSREFNYPPTPLGGDQVR